MLNMYAIYVNYTDIKYSIRDFKLFAYTTNDRWILLDSRTNIILKNNIIPNIFKKER